MVGDRPELSTNTGYRGTDLYHSVLAVMKADDVEDEIEHLQQLEQKQCNSQAILALALSESYNNIGVGDSLCNHDRNADHTIPTPGSMISSQGMYWSSEGCKYKKGGNKNGSHRLNYDGQVAATIAAKEGQYQGGTNTKGGYQYWNLGC